MLKTAGTSNMKNLLLIIISAFFFAINVSAQSRLFYDSEMKLSVWFDSLFKRNEVKYLLPDEKKLAYSDSIFKELQSILTEENAFAYPFDSLVKLGKITSPDSLVKVYTWNIKLSDHKFKYYGFILHRKHKNDKRARVFALQDYSDSIPDNELENLTLSHKKWYGASYYQITNYTYKDQTYYLLIGWDGYSAYINRKVVEIMYFNPKGVPIFGKAVFKSDEKTVKRIIFNHSIKAAMTCSYNEKEKAIIFDHLVPSFYGPNGTYDAYYRKKNLWIFKEDIETKNPPPKK